MLRKRQLESIVRGFSNHRRIEIMDLLFNNPELSVGEIADKLKINFKTTSGHLRRLINAGLIMKKSQKLNIRHKLSPRGLLIFKLLRKLE